jgi:5-methylcytosine-specific restriction protein A
MAFHENISPEYFYITLVLFFVKEYNYFKSTHTEHNATKQKAEEKYNSEKVFLKKYYRLLETLDTINYLSDVCYGRYYFLEVHFQEKDNPRNVPLSVATAFLQLQRLHREDFDLDEQKQIALAKPVSQNALEVLNNRAPVSVTQTGTKRYAVNARVAKTVLELVNYKCEVDPNHNTFYTKKKRHFTESHHFIPMACQDDYLPINLDRSENICSLCPNCHRAVHLGDDEEKRRRLEALYEKKIKGLNTCNINITFKQLMALYK